MATLRPKTSQGANLHGDTAASLHSSRLQRRQVSTPNARMRRKRAACLSALRLHPRAQAHRGEFHVVLAVNVHEAVSGLWLVCIPVWRVWACSVLLVIVCGVSIFSDNRTI